MPKLSALHFGEQLFQWCPFSLADPASGTTSSVAGSGPIVVDRDFVVYEMVETAAAQEYRTLSGPLKAGLIATFCLTTQNSSYAIQLTVLDSTGATTYTHSLASVPQYVTYISVCTYWNQTTANVTVNAKTVAPGQKVFSWLAVSGTIALTLVNETLTSPTLNTPTINQPNLYNSVNGGTPTAATVTTAAALPADDICPITSTNSAYLVGLPTGVAGQIVRILNTSSTAAKVAPATGGTLSGQSANSTISIAASAEMVCYCTAANTWLCYSKGVEITS